MCSPPVTPDDIFTYPPPSELPGAGRLRHGRATRPGTSEPVTPADAPHAPSEPVNPPVAPPRRTGQPDMPRSPSELPPPVSPDVPSDEGRRHRPEPDLLVPTEEPAEPDTFQG